MTTTETSEVVPTEGDERRSPGAAVATTRSRVRVSGRTTVVVKGRERLMQALMALLGARPSSIAALLAYTRAGGWVPGERPDWVEWPGKAYGYVVAVPVTAALYAVAAVVARPSRLLLAGVVLGLLLLCIRF